jgi:hypothetical protein
VLFLVNEYVHGRREEAESSFQHKIEAFPAVSAPSKGASEEAALNIAFQAAATSHEVFFLASQIVALHGIKLNGFVV